METKIIFLISAAIIATGCTSTNSAESGGGVQIDEFSISDNSLSPGQEANLRVQISNKNKNPTTIETVELYNKGELTIVESKDCSSMELRAATRNLIPKLECSWTIKAPGEGFLEGFDSRPTPIKLRVGYKTSFGNAKPLKLNYKELSDIKETGEKSVKFSNGKINIKMSGESPTDRTNPTSIDVKIKNTGSGRIDGNYTLEYTPDALLSNCPEKRKPILEKTAEFTCALNTGSTGTKNLFLTTEYKYIKSKNMNIEVVNN